jgi:hypothetical protein
MMIREGFSTKKKQMDHHQHQIRPTKIRIIISFMILTLILYGLIIKTNNDEKENHQRLNFPTTTSNSGIKKTTTSLLKCHQLIVKNSINITSSSAYVNNIRVPDFLIIGVQKAGTSAASRNLNRHPQIYLPQKELHFFDNVLNVRRGLNWYSQKLLAENYKQKPLVGEKTPHYVFSQTGMEHIHKLLPSNIKLILLIREPIQRAYSSFRMRTDFKLETRSFIQAIRDELQIIQEKKMKGGVVGLGGSLHSNKNDVVTSKTYYLERGFYRVQIDNVLKMFNPCQIHVAIMERILNHPRAEYQRMIEFLGANVTYLLNHDMNIGVFNQRGTELIVPDSVNGTNEEDVVDWEWDSVEVKKLRAELWRDIFREENERLFDVLGERVGEWEGY